MPQLFNAKSKAEYKGAFFTAAGSGLQFKGVNLNLVQSLQTSMQQPVTPLYEIGSNNRYYVVGKSTGTFTIAQILGFAAANGKTVLDQIADMADPCKVSTMTLTYPASSCEAGGKSSTLGLTLNMTGVLVQSLQVAQQAQDNIVTANVTGMFTDMTYGKA